MAEYAEWNRALWQEIRDRFRVGMPVYLETGRERIRRAGERWSSDGRDLVADFVAAVRRQLRVNPSEDSVDLVAVTGDGAKDAPPPGLAFLCFLTFVASQMSADEDYSERNYFSRFRQILGLDTSREGRPNRMRQGQEAEEPIWESWNRWLGDQGYQPTAARDHRKNYRYIGYAIRQVMLVEEHKRRLRKLFREQQRTDVADPYLVFDRVYRTTLKEPKSLGKYLSELITTAHDTRRQTLVEAIYDVYVDWLDAPDAEERVGQRIANTLSAGLCRRKDLFSGKVQYWLMPRLSSSDPRASIVVEHHGKRITLIRDDCGDGNIGIPVEPWELDRLPRTYPVLDTDRQRQIVLPKRDFFLFVPRPSNPDGDPQVTWEPPKLGQRFIILCRQSLVPMLNDVRHNKLVEWRGEPRSVGDSDWVELLDCKILDLDWGTLRIGNADLQRQLTPADRVSLSLSGGLRVPFTNDWLAGHGPFVRVTALRPRVTLRIDGPGGETVFEGPINREQSRREAGWWSEPGTYTITISAKGEDATLQRTIRLRSADDFFLVEPEDHRVVFSNVGRHRVRGAVLEEVQ